MNQYIEQLAGSYLRNSPCFMPMRSRHRQVLMLVVHSMHIIHCDIKPENILLNASNTAIIGDFSISQFMHADTQSSSAPLQQARALNGLLTPAFTPPELVQTITPGTPPSSPRQTTQSNPLQLTFATDIWAFGITLFCFVHGTIPFQASSLDLLYQAILDDPISKKISSKLPPSLADLITKMLEKDPKKRIPLQDIKIHPWVTCFGEDPMTSKQENCRLGLLDEMSEDEIKSAIQPAVTLLDKIKERLSLRNRKKQMSMSSVLTSSDSEV
jgi:[calcium/calmodulin-dependent protein kinase] kinase